MLRLTLLLLMITTSAFAAEPGPAAASIRVECHGLLRHGVVAIGGETTGTTIGFDRMTWELNLPNEAVRSFASDHDKQHVFVAGLLRHVKGTEVRERWIVDVERLTERDAGSPKVGATVIVDGKLTSTDRLTGEKTAELRIDANGVSLPLVFSDDQMLADKAKTLVDKPVIVTGLIDRIPSKTPLHMTVRVSKLDLPMSRPSKAK